MFAGFALLELLPLAGEGLAAHESLYHGRLPIQDPLNY